MLTSRSVYRTGEASGMQLLKVQFDSATLPVRFIIDDSMSYKNG